MPTYGYIHETVEDRFYERGGGTTRAPRILLCPVCGAEVPDQPSLAVHVGSAHPLDAPRLLIHGAVVVGERVLHRHLDPDAVQITNANELVVSENGQPPQPWSVVALRETLAEADSIILDVMLKNRRTDDDAAAVEQVRLAIDVPDAAALDQVDRHFEEILAVDELDEHRLDRFADEIAGLPRASRYASALHEYGVAILVKDRAVGIADSLPFEAHRQKLQAALNVLRHFPERPVARAVSGFIRFGLNDLAGDRPSSGVPALDRCVRALQGVLNLEPTRVAESASSAVGRCPTDQTTSFILEEWDDADSFFQLVERASSGSTTPDDAAKCRALAARLNHVGPPSILDLARTLVNDLVFGTWASRIVENHTAHG
jgi:hypothetical protein